MTSKNVFSLVLAMFLVVGQCSPNGLNNAYAADPLGNGQNNQSGVNPFGDNNNNQTQGIPPGNNLNGNPLSPAVGYDIKGYAQKDISWEAASGVSVNSDGLLTLANSHATATSKTDDETNRITYGQTVITGKFKPNFEGIISLKGSQDPNNLYLQTQLKVQNGDGGTKWITFYAPRSDNGGPYEGVKIQLSANEFNGLEFSIVRGYDSIGVYFRKSGEAVFNLAYKTNHNNRVDPIINSASDIANGKGLKIEVKGTGSLNIRMSDKKPLAKGSFYVSNTPVVDVAGNSLGDGTEENPFSVYDVLEGKLGIPANSQIVFKPGSYVLSRPLEVLISGVKIIGNGATIIPGGEMLGKATAESECMHLRGENIELVGFKFTNAPNYDPAQNRFQPESSGGGNSDGYFKGNSGYAIRTFGKNITIRGCDFANITGGIAGHADGLLTIADNSFAWLGYKSWARNYGDGMSIYISLANPAARVATTGNVFGPALGGLKFFSYVNAVANITFENNVTWNPTDGRFKRSESGGLFFATVHDDNPALNSMHDLAVNNNQFYNNGLGFGWEPNVIHRGVEAVNNYIAGGTMSFTNWQDILATHNTIVSSILPNSDPTLLSLYLPQGTRLDSESEIDFNHYYSLATSGTTNELWDDFTVRGKNLPPDTYRFDQARVLVGNDEASSYTHGLPISEKQIVTPSRYDANYAVATVYNWTGKDTTELNVSDFAKDGDRIELRDFQNKDVVVNVYTVVNGKITVPLNLTATSKLYGFTDSTNPHTSKEFNAFSLKIVGNAGFTQVTQSSANFSVLERRIIEIGAPGEAVTVAAPLHGTLSRIGGNRYIYESSPDARFARNEDAFSYTRANGQIVEVKVRINQGDVPSQLATPDTVTTVIGTPASIDLSNYVSDADTDRSSLKFRIVRQPAQGAAVLNGNVLTFTPSNSYVRESNVQVEVYNSLTGVKSEPVDVRFYVRDLNGSDTGAVVHAPLQAVVGQQVNLSWSVADGGQRAGDFVIVRNVGTGEVVNYQFTENEIAGSMPTTFTSAGTYSFSYLTNGLTDRISLASATITIQQSAGSNLPIARNQLVQVGEDTPLTFQAVVSEASGELAGNPNFVLTKASKHGSVEFINGSIKYTPAANYSGEDSFSYQFRNSTGLLSNEATVSLTINPKNDLPVVGQIVAETNSYQLSAQDADSNFIWQWSGMKQDGSIVILGSGYGDSVLNLKNDSYLAGLNLKKVMAMVYDGGIAVTREWIAPPPSVPVPVVTPITVTTDEDNAINFQLSAKYPDGSNVPNPVFSIVASPQSGSLQVDNLGRAIFTPSPNFNGDLSATYRVFDGKTYSEPASISFRVNAVNDAPSLVVDGSTTVEEGKAVSLVAVGQDPDGDTLTYSIIGLPQGASFNSQMGLLTWTPGTDQAGTYQLIFKASDGAVSVEKAITLTITDAPQNPPGNAPAIVIDALTGIVTGNLFRTLADGLLSLSNNLDPSQIDKGKVTFTLNLSENEAGNYYLWVRNQSPSPKSDSYFAAANGQSPVIFDTVSDNRWNSDLRWSRLSPRNASGDPDFNHPIALSLKAGTNTIVIGVREAGMLLSKIVLTQDRNYDPKNATPNNIPQLSEIKTNSANPQLGDSIVFSASANKPVSWGWSVVDPSGKEMIALSGTGNVQDFNYKPLKAGEYTIKISATDGANPVVVKSLSLIVGPGKPIVSDIAKEMQENSISIPITAVYADGSAVAAPVIKIVSSSNAQVSINGGQIVVTRTSNEPVSIQYKVNDGTNDSNVATISLTLEQQSQIVVQDGTSFKAANASEIQISGNMIRASERRDSSRYYVTAAQNNLTGQAPGSASMTFYSDKADVYYALLEVYAPTSSNDSFEIFLNGQRLGIYDMLQNKWGATWQTEFLSTRENGTLPLGINVRQGINTLEFRAREAYSALSKVTLVKSMPIAKPLEMTTNEDGEVSSRVEGENADRYAVNTSTQNGTLVFNADGSFKYTPRENFNGVDSFTYYAVKGSLESSAVKVTIQVLSVNDSPAVQIQVPETAELNKSVSLVASGSDIDGDPLTYQWSIFNAAGQRIAAGTGAQWRYSFAATGDYRVTVTVSDSKVSTQTSSIIKVNAPAIAVRNFSTSLQRPDGTISTDSTIEIGGTIKGNATVVTNDPKIKSENVLWTWYLTDTKTNSTIVLVTGLGALQNLRYVIPADFSPGSYRLNLQITVGSTISLYYFSGAFEVKKKKD